MFCHLKQKITLKKTTIYVEIVSSLLQRVTEGKIKGEYK
jgi:hypothetical protein